MKMWKRIAAFVLALIVAVSMYSPVTAVKASDDDVVVVKKTITLMPKENFIVGLKISELDGVSGEPQNKLSKPGIVKIDDYTIYEGMSFGVYGKALKPGKTVFTYDGFSDGGSDYKYILTINVKSYKNPVKSCKVGGKNLTRKFKKGAAVFFNPNSKRQKVSLKLKSGWKIAGITVLDYKTFKNKKISKLSQFDTTKHGNCRITVKNKKTGKKEIIMLYQPSGEFYDIM